MLLQTFLIGVFFSSITGYYHRYYYNNYGFHRFSICQNWCYRYNVHWPHNLNLVCCSYSEKPGYCPVENRCLLPVNAIFTRSYRCDFDVQCPTGYKCCCDSCYEHKICKPAMALHYFPNEDRTSTTGSPTAVTESSPEEFFPDGDDHTGSVSVEDVSLEYVPVEMTETTQMQMWITTETQAGAEMTTVKSTILEETSASTVGEEIVDSTIAEETTESKTVKTTQEPLPIVTDDEEYDDYSSGSGDFYNDYDVPSER